jgi:hypothetical protein
MPSSCELGGHALKVRSVKLPSPPPLIAYVESEEAAVSEGAVVEDSTRWIDLRFALTGGKTYSPFACLKSLAISYAATSRDVERALGMGGILRGTGGEVDIAPT